MMNSNMLPIGYTFSPTDQELLSFYLFHKIVGDFVPPFVLPIIDLYGQQPSQIWQQCGGIDGQDIYFFTTLKKKKSRVVRKVGCNGATWSGENKANKVFSSVNNALIGSVKRFHYENSKVKVEDNHYSWIMYEYTLDPNFVPKGAVHDSFVLCMLRKKILKQEKRTFSTTIQTSVSHNWPTTQMVVCDDPNPKRRKLEECQLVNLENEFCINGVNFENQACVDTGRFTEDEMQRFIDGYNLEPNQFRENIIQPLMIENQTGMGYLMNQPYDNVEAANACPIMQMEPHDRYDPIDETVLAKDIEMELQQTFNYEESSKREKDSNYDHGCPTTQVESNDHYSIDDNIFAKELEMALEPCNDVELQNREKY
ncbi:unnamed protein product [Citrullus colocynthis]|uniref:NAC domain-containing protein n=1 Tax=Citrullus colocynthis TaxID=252529 RepID=A0ABP0ZDN8_9ROSI